VEYSLFSARATSPLPQPFCGKKVNCPQRLNLEANADAVRLYRRLGMVEVGWEG